jgi:hypothetical protein
MVYIKNSTIKTIQVYINIYSAKGKYVLYMRFSQTVPISLHVPPIYPYNCMGQYL